MYTRLIQHTHEPERTIAAAARLCYSTQDAMTLFDGLTHDDTSRLIRLLVNSGHMSALEHASFTFAIAGISRACSHQLVRNRLASYSQQSQRYVDLSTKAAFIVPSTIANSPLADDAQALIDAGRALYGRLIDEGVPAEDARYLLPQAVETKIVVTMNARELVHFFRLRCCRRAQWEIRRLALMMLRDSLSVAPVVFETAGPSCLHGACSEGTFGCGQPVGGIEELFEEIESG